MDRNDRDREADDDGYFVKDLYTLSFFILKSLVGANYFCKAIAKQSFS